MDYTHEPVLLRQCIQALRVRPEGVYVDGTLGRGGHARAIAGGLTTGRLIAIDRDEAAIDAAPALLGGLMDKITLVHGNFRDLPAILDGLELDAVDGMLFDLGVSSPQLDDGARGFSYGKDAPLDMRMDRRAPLTAAEVVNTWPERELKDIFWRYGEERHAGLIAAAILRARGQAPIETTLGLVDVIRSAMPAAALREKQHPAKRVFQAIRIAVNDELGAEEELLNSALSRLRPGGRLAVISFHSLEDRIVKTAFAAAARGCTCPPDFPVCVCGKRPQIKLISRKPVMAGAEEISRNPRARSARLRVAEKLPDGERVS